MSTVALSRFARGLAAVLEDLATELEASIGEEKRVLSTEPVGDPEEGRALGKRQRQIIQLPGLRDEAGMKTAEIASSIDYDVPNVYLTLQGLQRMGMIEQVVGVTPQRWRFTARYRATAEPYIRVAGQVRKGEWTTYGDISIAHRGDTLAARAVGRAAATLAMFPNPHRVLKEGGLVPEGWHDHEGRGPDECRRRLEAEGVSFTDDGRADPAHRVTWDVLVDRVDGH